MTFTPVTVTGNRVADGGQQAHGWSLTFTLAAPITDGQTTIDPTPITVAVADDTGAFTAVLQTPPIGAAIYRVAETLAFRHAYYITLTADDAPSVDLDSIPHTLLQPPVAPYVRSINGLDGDVTLTVADIDGGNATSVYTATQTIDGGSA